MRTLGSLRRDDLDLLYVNPQQIKMTINRSDLTLTGSGVWHIGRVAGGDWDLEGAPVSQRGGVFNILQQRFKAGLEYEAIPEFQANLAAIRSGQIIDSSASAAEYHARWLTLEQLYAAIRDEGYKTQAELQSDNPLDEIRVQIGRHGNILFEEGLHRLAIAQLLELTQVPALVTRRHTEWAQLRQSVLKIVLQRGFIHQLFDHPDLDSLPAKYGGDLAAKAQYGPERWEYIRASLPVESGSVLDIGAYFGYFDHRLEDVGFECFAVEPDPENLEVLRRYRGIQTRRFTVWDCSVFEIERFEYDVVLALNIFHHLVRDQENYRKLVFFLKRLRCRALYFEPDPNAGVQAYKQFSDEAFVRFVQTHTGLSQARCLGTAREGRPVFLLER